MTAFGTRFAETEAILAAQEEEWGLLAETLGRMSDDERERLRIAARDLGHAIAHYPLPWGPR